MSSEFVPFDDMRRRAVGALEGADLPDTPIYLVRNLYGKVSISVSDRVENNEACRKSLCRLAGGLSAALGERGLPADDGVLYVGDSLLQTLRDTAKPIGGFHKVFWEDRLVTGNGWWTAGDLRPEGQAKRWTLFSVKGGVGRSTTAAVLARHLAREGERVLVVDLDLESPGLSSAMLAPGEEPDFGVVDWFVEDLVGQSNRVIERMTAAPGWARDFNGDARVVPAHGADPGEYLAKLGRVYMDRRNETWAARLDRMLGLLERDFQPSTVLIESRSGLQDIGAATVTDIGADILLFATDSASSWADYRILFRHWRECGLAKSICERLSVVSALTPLNDRTAYLDRFRETAWGLFQRYMYEPLSPSCGADDEFSFDVRDADGPHNPMPIFWTEGLAAGTSLRDPGEAAVKVAYQGFFDRFAALTDAGGEEAAR